MKIRWIFITAVLLFACNSQPGTEKQDDSDTPNAEWVVVKLNVEGMTCDGCENAIKAGVESLEGIAEVESSHEEAWTRVTYDKSVTSLEEIEEKITETGYTVVGEL